MLGVLGPDDLKAEIDRSHLGAVTQAYSGGEFNVPSKLMNYLAVGLPVVASVRPESEAARIVEQSGAGWVSDSSDPERIRRVDGQRRVASGDDLTRRAGPASTSPGTTCPIDVLADKFEATLAGVVA